MNPVLILHMTSVKDAFLNILCLPYLATVVQTPMSHFNRKAFASLPRKVVCKYSGVIRIRKGTGVETNKMKLYQ